MAPTWRDELRIAWIASCQTVRQMRLFIVWVIIVSYGTGLAYVVFHWMFP